MRWRNPPDTTLRYSVESGGVRGRPETWDDAVIVARPNGTSRAAGRMTIYPTGRYTTKTSMHGRGYYSIASVWVREPYRKKGVGLRLYLEALKLAQSRGCKLVSDSEERNSESEGLHKSLRKYAPHKVEKMEGYDVDVYGNPQRSKRARNPGSRFMPLRSVSRWEPLAREMGVSEVARSSRGFLAQYRRAGGASKLSAWWRARREAFIRRHMAQVRKRGEPLWDKRGRPTRRHLALMMWAFSPSRRNA